MNNIFDLKNDELGIIKIPKQAGYSSIPLGDCWHVLY